MFILSSSFDALCVHFLTLVHPYVVLSLLACLRDAGVCFWRAIVFSFFVHPNLLCMSYCMRRGV